MNFKTVCTFQTRLDVCSRGDEGKRLSLPVQPRSNSVSESTMSKRDEIMSKRHTEWTTEATDVRHAKLGECNHNVTLHKACSQGKLDAVICILSHGLEDINCLGKRRKTPVMEAARMGHFTVFDYLVGQDCDMSVVDDRKNTVLHYACRGGNAEIVRNLIVNKNCDKGRQNNKGRRPIMWAATRGHIEVFKLLVSKGCSLATGGNPNNNILHLACKGGHLDMVQYILSLNRCSIESKAYMGRTPVMSAAVSGHKGVFELLVEKGCSLTVVDKFKNNVLHAACTGGNLDIVQYILSLTIYSIESREHKGRTPVIIAALSGHKGVVELLVGKGCSLTVVDIDKYNILHAACWGGNADIVKYLMTLRAVEGMEKAMDKHGHTPVQVAEGKGHKAVVRLLKGRE